MACTLKFSLRVVLYFKCLFLTLLWIIQYFLYIQEFHAFQITQRNSFQVLLYIKSKQEICMNLKKTVLTNLQNKTSMKYMKRSKLKGLKKRR